MRMTVRRTETVTPGIIENPLRPFVLDSYCYRA